MSGDTRIPEASSARCTCGRVWRLSCPAHSPIAYSMIWAKHRRAVFVWDEDEIGPSGRCDTCGAPMTEWVCPADRTHEVIRG